MILQLIDDFYKMGKDTLPMKRSPESLHKDLEIYAKILYKGISVLDSEQGVEKERLKYKTIRGLTKKILNENGGYIQYFDHVKPEDYTEDFMGILCSNDQSSDLEVLLMFLMNKNGLKNKSYWTTKTKQGYYRSLPLLYMLYTYMAREELDIYMYLDTMEQGSVEPPVLLDFNDEELDAVADDKNSDTEGEQKEEEKKEELNYDSPKINLQQMLKESWFDNFRSVERYDSIWTDNFIEALMQSDYADQIARDWSVDRKRNKKPQIKAYILGLLHDNGVLKDNYNKIAEKVNLMGNPRSFAKYMSNGKNQPYAGWVKDYITGDNSQ